MSKENDKNRSGDGREWSCLWTSTSRESRVYIGLGVLIQIKPDCPYLVLLLALDRELWQIEICCR